MVDRRASDRKFADPGSIPKLETRRSDFKKDTLRL